ncbi:MAG: hypothetical protein PVJ38_02740 [Candidatus Bathyarchaeota archaeon]
MEEIGVKERLDILDLIINVLAAHEEKMDAHTRRLEELCRRIEESTRYQKAEVYEEILDRLFEKKLKI